MLALSSITGGAGPLEVIRVRIPASKVDSAFPQGSELRVMPEREFEELVRSARSRADVQSVDREPRLLRAKHSATWVDGKLRGESEFLVEPAARTAMPLDLSPWTPAIESTGAEADALRVRNDGRVFLWLAAGKPRTFSVKWELQARPGADGRVFALGLPRLDAASLDLDLPDSYLPEGPAGVRQGPMPGSMQGRSRWRFDGPGGLIDLRLRNLATKGTDRSQPQVWVGGGTRVDVGEASATWRADWQVHFSGGGPRRLSVDLDPGLEVLDVQGPALVSYQVEATASGSRLAIRFGDDVKEQTSFIVRATARVPDEGPWSVPAAKPVETAWTGGRTVVRITSARVLEDCQDRAGLRVSPRREDLEGAVSTGLLLTFASSAPRSVAELVFRRPEADASAEVRGQILLGPDGTRLEAAVTWKVERGRIPDLTLDLPPGWTPERVQIVGIDEPTPWLTEPRIGGGTRVLVHLPPVVEAASSVKLSLVARGAHSGRGGALDLPHVLPVGVRVSDEVWLARAGGDVSLRPIEADGLVWLAPELAVFDPAAAQSTLLAWRWIRTDGHARVAPLRRGAERHCAIMETVSLHADRYTVSANVTIDAGDVPVRSLVVGLSESLATAPEWRLQDEGSGPPLPLQRRRNLDIAKLPGFARGASWTLTLPHPRRGRIQLVMKGEQPWGGSGSLPLVALPEFSNVQGTVVVLADRAMRTTVETSGLRLLDASAVAPSAIDMREADKSAQSQPSAIQPLRLAHAFGYGARSGRLKIATEALQPIGAGAFISEALLFTTLMPSGAARHELLTRIASQGDPTVEVTLPARLTLERVTLDGRVVAPSRDRRGSLSVPLPTPNATRAVSTLLLEYRQDAPASGSGPDRALDHPSFELPVLSWTWCCAAAGDGDIDSEDLHFTPATPEHAPSWWGSRVVAPWARVWSNRRNRTNAQTAVRILSDLESRTSRMGEGAKTLQDLVAVWDGSTYALIVDRAMLDAAGIGSRRMLPALPPKSTPPGWLRNWLQKGGLDLLIRDGYPLLTAADDPLAAAESGDERESDTETFRIAASEAAATGVDRSDRYQSAPRWIADDVSGTTSRRPELRTDQRTLGRGAHRLVSFDWSAVTTSLRFVDRRAWPYWASALAISIVVAGIVLRGLSAFGKALVASILVAAIVVTGPWLSSRANIFFTGLLCGTLGTIAFWIGRALRKTRAGAQPTANSTLTGQGRRRESGVVVGAGLLLALACTLAERSRAQEQPPADRPILAVFPDDPKGNHTEGTGKVILLLKDFERLRTVVDDRPKRAVPLIGATDAHHVVTITGGKTAEAVLESRLVLWIAGDGDARWAIPVAGARDMSATVDGSEAVVHVEPGGQSASIFLSGAGRHDAVVRRTIALDRGDAWESLSIAVNAIPTARLTCRLTDIKTPLVLPGARGEVVHVGDRLEGRLGPVNRFEIRHVDEAANQRQGLKGAAEGLILWDAEPSGDRLRARITYRNTAGLTKIRLALDPGLVVLSATVPGLVDTSWQGAKDHPEWVAQVDPAIADGSMIELVLWRPAETAPVKVAGGIDETSRRLPRLEPLDVESYVGTVAFRRPEGWSGRLRPVAGSDPVTDESFARLWGNLPDAAATLSGVIRFSVPPRVDVPTGPVSVRTTARPELELELQPGRLLVRARTALTDIQGRSREMVVSLPAEFRLQRVDAPGLTAWTRRSREQLRLRFDGNDTAPRQLQIDGWIPIGTDPLALTPATHELPLPWLTPAGVELEAGTVSVSSQSGVTPHLLPAGGKSAPVVIANGPTPTLGRSLSRTSYRVDRPGETVTLQWTDEPVRGEVMIRSLLTIHPDTAEWTATVRFRATQGPIGSILLKVPTVWAESSRVVIHGAEQRVQSDVRGDETTWSIRFPTPEWGTQTLVIHSSRRLPSGKPLDFPDVVPLGRGTVDTYLGLVNASGMPLTSEGSSGLQPIDTTRFPSEDFPARRGPLTELFRVRKDGWRLQIRAGAPDAASAASGNASVSLADVTVSLTPDGVLKGEARYELEPRHDAFLPVNMPSRAEVVGALVDGLPARPYRGTSGQILIPLPGSAASRVVLLWSLKGAAVSTASGHDLPLPALTQDNVPTLVTLYAPESLLVQAPSRLLVSAGPATLDVERAEWLAKRILETLGSFDRSSSADQTRLLAGLVRFEVVARSATRAMNRAGGVASAGAVDEAESLSVRLAATRQNLTEAIQAAGLEDYLRSAEARVGIGMKDPLENLSDITGVGSSVRVPRLGRAAWFRTTSSREGTALRLTTRPRSRQSVWANPQLWAATLGGIAVLFAVPLSFRRITRPSASLTWLLAAATLLVATLAGPIAGGLALVMFGLGRLSHG